MMRLLIALVLASLGSIAMAEDTPIVRIEVTPATIAVGEPIRLRVTVLGPTWFPKSPRYPSFEIPNAVVSLPPNSTRPTRAKVDGETWNGTVRNYQVFPLIGANYRLDKLSMQVTYADPEDRSPVVINIDLPPIEFQAVVPTGAEGLEPYISGARLSLTRELDRDTEFMAAGDALKVQFKAELDGLPAMFLPDLVSFDETPGMSVYPEQPVVLDENQASRTETLTFVFEAGGEFIIPGASLDWWNTKTSKIETTSVAPLSVTVSGPVLPEKTVEESPSERNWAAIFGIALLLIAAFRVLRGVPEALRTKWSAYQQRRRESERYAFDNLRKSLHNSDPHAAYAALVEWFDRVDSGTDLRRFALQYGDADLHSKLDQLSAQLYSESKDDLNIRQLDSPLTTARDRYQQTLSRHKHSLLPPLNP